MYLNLALAAILVGVGCKMMGSCAGYEVSSITMLVFMVGALATAVVASLVKGPRRLENGTQMKAV